MSVIQHYCMMMFWVVKKVIHSDLLLYAKKLL